MKKLLFLIILLCSVFGYGQTVYTDSLMNAADTVYTQRLWYGYENYYVSADNYGDHSIDLDVKVGTYYTTAGISWFTVPLIDSSGTVTFTWTIAAGQSSARFVDKKFPAVIKVEATTNSADDSVRVNIEGVN